MSLVLVIAFTVLMLLAIPVGHALDHCRRRDAGLAGASCR